MNNTDADTPHPPFEDNLIQIGSVSVTILLNSDSLVQ